MTRLRCFGWSSIVPGVLSVAFLSGCGANNNVAGSAAGQTIPNTKQGKVHGGQQPVAGSTLQLYAVGTTRDGSAATPLLTQPVTSDANGNFTISGDYTCPSSTALVYVVATGGNPGLAAGTNNADLAMMTALGPCGNLTASTYIFINEVTTVAAVWSLAPYMSSYSAIGSGTGDAAGLTKAFTQASELANTTTGTTPGVNVPAGVTVPVAYLNTLADILSTCVNSAGGVAGDGSTCGTLLGAATYLGTAPTDLIAATVNIVNNPTSNVAALYSLVPAAAPFQPALMSAPLSLTLSLTPPALSFSTTSLTFSNTTVGFSTATQTVTVTNMGTVTVPINGMLSSGATSSFTLSSNCNVALAPSATCTLQIAFVPSLAGGQSETIGFSSGTTAYPQQLTATGTGVAGTNAGPITLTPSTLSFSQIGIPQTLTLTNSGSAALAIGNISLVGTSASTISPYLETRNCGSVLDAQSICNIFISATELSVSAFSGQLVVADDSISSPHYVPLNTPISSTNTSLPAQLSFGSWVVGTQNIPTQTFAVSTTRTNSAFTLGTSITGPNASDFAASSLSCPFNCTDTVSFSPSAVGLRVATLVTAVGNVPLSGTGTTAGPSFFLAPAYPLLATFPISAAVNMSSAALQYTAFDNGSTNVQLGTAVSGPNANEFAVTNTCSSQMGPAGSCGLSIVFSPVQPGPRSATLTVTDSVSGLQQTLALTGIAQYPGPAITPKQLYFTNVQVGGTTAPQILTITTPNGDPVRVTSSALTGPMASIFPIDPGSCWAGTPCQISVSFQPPNANDASEYFSVIDSITGTLTGITVSGDAGVHADSLSSYSLMFAARDEGSTSIAQTITLTSNGNLPLYITGVSLAGANPGDFSIQSNTCAGTIAVNGTCAVSISFAPTASGARAAVLQIVSNAATSPDTVQLSGTGN